SPRLAEQLGVVPPSIMMNRLNQSTLQASNFVAGRDEAHIAELTIDGRKIKAPLNILPGLANFTVVLPLGFGRTDAGRVGTGTGFNFYTIRTSGDSAFAQGGKLEVTGETYNLANTQQHWSMEGRALVREANVDEY